MSTVGSSRGRPVVVTAEQIESVALRLWSERGFQEVSVADVAAAAGVTARTIFRRYPTKADIVWGPLAESFHALGAALVRSAHEVSVLERACAAVVAVIRDGDTDPTSRNRIRIIGRTPELQSSTSAPFRLWRQVLFDFAAAQPGIDPLHAHVLAQCVQGAAVAGIVWWAAEEPDTAPWQAVDGAFARLLGGVGPAGAGAARRPT